MGLYYQIQKKQNKKAEFIIALEYKIEKIKLTVIKREEIEDIIQDIKTYLANRDP